MSAGVLDGKVIVIVGGTGGLGLSAAEACLRAGARLVVVGRDPDRCEAARARLGTDAEVLAGDASDPHTAAQAVERAIERFGQLDGLYHVAGGSGRRFGDGPLHEITDAGLQATIELNLHSLFYSNRAAVQQLLRQGRGGSILNMSSVLADSPSPRYFATHTYAATKAAVVGLTNACASYYAVHQIRFNAVAPALVDTPLATRAMQDAAIQAYIATKQPLDGGRVGRPNDLDAAVVFFLSDESKFVTGQVLAIDGGWKVTEGQHGRATREEMEER